jgi:hypothetical protein
MKEERQANIQKPFSTILGSTIQSRDQFALAKIGYSMLLSQKSFLILCTFQARQYAPELVQTPAGLQLNTRFTRLLGKPHVMVAGMTPTSANATFCAAVLNAGFHVELAGGGQHSEAMMRDTVQKITDSIVPGDSFGVNLLYLNQRQWGFQFPLVLQLRRQGYPISGITIGAGVPTPDRAKEIIDSMRGKIALKSCCTNSCPHFLDFFRKRCGNAFTLFETVLCRDYSRSQGHCRPQS